MCGHVGVFGKDIRTTDLEVFKDLLWLDQLRGRHGTGVGVMGSDYTIHTLKRADDADAFLQDKAFTKLCTDVLNTTARAVMGHNRYATVGNVTDHDNAHPFLHGNVVTAHNGTLDSRMGLEGSALDYEVDSDQLAYTMSVKPLGEFIEKVDGAFALVWMDNGKGGDNSINFIRNHERPMWLAKVKDKDIWFYASEKEMIALMTSRKRRSYDLEYEELKVGEHRKYALGKRGTTLETTQYDLPRFQSYWQGKSYAGGAYGGTKSYRSKVYTPPANQHKRFEDEYKIKKGNKVSFIPEYFAPYGNGKIVANTYGYVVGHLSDAPAIPAIIGSMQIKDFIENFATSNKLSDVLGETDVDTDVYTEIPCEVSHFATHHRERDGRAMLYSDDANIQVPQVMVKISEKQPEAERLSKWLIPSWSSATDDMSTSEFTDKHSTCSCCNKPWTDAMLATIGWFDADEPVCAECVEDLNNADIYTAERQSILVGE